MREQWIIEVIDGARPAFICEHKERYRNNFPLSETSVPSAEAQPEKPAPTRAGGPE